MSKKLISIIISSLMVMSIGLTGCGTKTTVSENATSQTTNNEVSDALLAPQEIMSTGPNGEKATPADNLKLTDEEIEKVKSGNYKAAIVLHYAGNDWSTAQIQGIKDTAAKLNIEIVGVTDAQFKVEKQVSDIETVMALNPNVIFSIPTDPVATAPAYKKAADKGVKLVFMDNAPTGLTVGEDYLTVVSADNYGNGVAAANIMAKELNGKGKVGVIYYDANFFVTQQRTDAFEKTIEEKYPDIKIVDRGGFTDPNKVAEVSDGMLTKNPDLDGIFAVWDVPAESVIASAKASGRSDLVVTTIDLGNNIARLLAAGEVVKGVGAQLPYDQGVTEVMAAAYSLLGKEVPPYIAVPSLAVTKNNVLESYKKVYQKDAPDDVIKAAGN